MSQSQTWNAGDYDRRHNYVWRYGESLLELLNPQSGQRILDLGCGTGHLTDKIAAAGVQVVGLDQSAEMIARARSLYPQMEFIQGDATHFRFESPFDAVFSNAVLHWIHTPEKVIACVWEALKPGGVFVAEMGGKGNVAAIISSAFGTLTALGVPQPERSWWYFPSVAEYAALLEKQGFRVTFMAHFDRPTSLEGEEGLADWLRMYLSPLLATVPEEKQGAFFEEAQERARATLFYENIWHADYVRLRFMAVKPGG